MGKTDRNLQALNWLEKEKHRDRLETESVKEKLIKDIKSLKKQDLFDKEEIEEKKSIWDKLKKIIWGN